MDSPLLVDGDGQAPKAFRHPPLLPFAVDEAKAPHQHLTAPHPHVDSVSPSAPPTSHVRVRRQVACAPGLEPFPKQLIPLIFHNMWCGRTATVASSHDRLPGPFRMLALPMLDRDGVAAPLRRLRRWSPWSLSGFASLKDAGNGFHRLELAMSAGQKTIGPASVGPFFLQPNPSAPSCFRCGRTVSLPRVIQSKTGMAQPRSSAGRAGLFSTPTSVVRCTERQRKPRTCRGFRSSTEERLAS